MSIIICPNCRSVLGKANNGMKCENGHSFDIAKEGYVNLLLSNQKKKNNPGDNGVMINAREEFLSAGHFDILLSTVESVIETLDLFPKTKTTNLLDLGCGTGYYTRSIFKENKLNRVGIDISKRGVAKAAKQDKSSTYLVGSVFDLTIADRSTDILINIFSPIDLKEAQRVLKPGGLFIKIIPSGDHMKEVATMVYDNFIPHESSIEADVESTPGFRIIQVENPQKTISLDKDHLRNFISMTPYLYKFSEAQLESLKELSVTLSFKIIIATYNEDLKPEAA